MGNRRKTLAARVAQHYRNAQSRMVIVIPRVRRDGEWVRNEGHYNRPYGPVVQSPHTGVLAFRKEIERTRRDYSAAPDLSAMNRDALRSLAKERGVKGYGHMTTARLREVLS